MSNCPVSTPIVLIVEDESIIRDIAREMLEDTGFSVIEAATADEAVQILESRSDVSVLFTDVDMPGSMNGFMLAARVAHRWPQIRLVVTSGRYWPSNDDLPDAGQFLPKPYQLNQLVSTIRFAA